MPEGKIRFYNGVNGYGFIIPDGGGQDVFLHHSALAMTGPQKKSLRHKMGQTIQYELKQTEKGPAAVNARLLVELPK